MILGRYSVLNWVFGVDGWLDLGFEIFLELVLVLDGFQKGNVFLFNF